MKQTSTSVMFVQLSAAALAAAFLFCLSFHSGECSTVYGGGTKPNEDGTNGAYAGESSSKDNHGMLQLILHELAHEIVHSMDASEATRLNDKQKEFILEKIINGFYNHIKEHPAMETNRVIFAQFNPDLPSANSLNFPEEGEAEEGEVQEDGDQEASLMSKRGSGPKREICKSKSEWVKLEQAYTKKHQLVKLYENQFFYVTKCEKSKEQCFGVDGLSRRAICMEKKSWSIAYIWSDKERQYIWDWIALDTCCSCALSDAK